MDYSLERERDILDLSLAMKYYTRRTAFTLIELLVVIAIIGILASLLLPVLGRAKKKARTLQSISNQRNIAAAYVMYLDDNEGWYPVVAGPASVGGKQGFGHARAVLGVRRLAGQWLVGCAEPEARELRSGEQRLAANRRR